MSDAEKRYRIKEISQITEEGCLVQIELTPESSWVEVWTLRALEKFLNQACDAGALRVDELHAMPGY